MYNTEVVILRTHGKEVQLKPDISFFASVNALRIRVVYFIQKLSLGEIDGWIDR